MMDFEKYKETTECKELLEKFKRKLKIRGFDICEESNVSLLDEIEDAIEAINNRRHFVPTNDRLFETQYKGKVLRLAICSYSKMGAEGELAHSENGVSRTYAGASEYPNDILEEIVPLGRIREL